MKSLFSLIFLTFSLLIVSCSPQTKKETKVDQPPNFVVVFIDDMGYGDIGTQGATGWTTPNLDKMAAEGMRFTNFYSAQPVCSASRAGILTGCYPNRIGISGALFPHHEVGINPAETTIAEMLKEKGYATGIFGKWHLGHHKEFLPLQHGFDEYVGLPYSNDMWPIGVDGVRLSEDKGRGKYPDLPLIEGNETLELITTLEGQDKLTTLYTEKAVDFINRNSDKPFFVYVPHTMGHVPLGVSEKFRGKSEQGFYGDVMMEIDWSVGEIEKALKANGVSENTVFIFTTDNGPWLNYGNHAGSSGGLREGKTTSWEGGQRVPFIIKWPAGTPAGTISDKLGCAVDLLPSFAKLARTSLPELKIDGLDITELWKGNNETEPRDNILFYHGKNHLNGVRKGNWKLVLPHTWNSYHAKPGNDGHGGPRPKMTVESPELYNMMRDLGEEYNVIEYYPEKAEELMKVVEAARAELGDLNVGIEKGVGTREIGRK
ncbi:MAG: sulfatase [Prolixibacteraceae bacterium]|jgi:arylsulfatase A-like enzyme|nr:sulfatase [Prolixibacteraceae bacterium]MBT6765610.1 sulfatase [Prolixibacteraceae bacterium]MBT7000074.1 sulfatase [Prolixibacteraceae bacterium]MBT7396944.1 sulfatase [Prolixibacteraceae bacterium]